MITQKMKTAQKNKKLSSNIGMTSKNKSPTATVEMVSTQEETKKFNTNERTKTTIPVRSSTTCFLDLRIVLHSPLLRFNLTKLIYSLTRNNNLIISQ